MRRAQERTLVALESVIRLVEWGLWRAWSDSDSPIVISLKGEISSLGPRARRTAMPAMPAMRSEPPCRELSLATFAVCLDAIESIAEARGILPLPQAERIRQHASDLRKRMISELVAVSSEILHTQSRAFGTDDPLTASWLLPILRKDAAPVTGPRSARRLDKLEPKVGDVSLFGNVREGIMRLLSPGKYMIVGGGGGRTNTAEEHAWPASLAVRAMNLVTRGRPKSALNPRAAEALRVWSEQEVRLQLARSVTGEAGQDAAHLAAAIAVAMIEVLLHRRHTRVPKLHTPVPDVPTEREKRHCVSGLTSGMPNGQQSRSSAKHQMGRLTSKEVERRIRQAIPSRSRGSLSAQSETPDASPATLLVERKRGAGDATGCLAAGSHRKQKRDDRATEPSTVLSFRETSSDAVGSSAAGTAQTRQHSLPRGGRLLVGASGSQRVCWRTYDRRAELAV